MGLYSMKEILYEKERMFSGSKYSLQEIAVNKEKICEPDEDGELNEIQTRFASKEKHMRDSLNTIFKIFGLEREQHQFQTKNQYLLNDDEKFFFVTLLNNYQEKTVWKKGIKKIQPVYGSFWKLYKSGSVADQDLLEEIEFVVKGLLGWFNRLHEDPDQREAIKLQLYNVTSLNSIKYAIMNKKIIVENVPILEANTGSFAFPALMSEHENYLGKLTEDLETFMRQKKIIWEDIQKRIVNWYTLLGTSLFFDKRYGEYITRFLEEMEKRKSEILKTKKIKEGDEEKVKQLAEHQAFMETIEKFRREDPERFHEEIGKYLAATGQLNNFPGEIE